MELYDVTVWDTSGGKHPDDWVVESPTVRVEAGDLYEAARKVASKGGLSLSSSSGIKRPYGDTGMFFKAPDEELIFQVEDANILRPAGKKWSFY